MDFIWVSMYFNYHESNSGHIIFTGDGTANFPGHLSHGKVQLLTGQKQYFHFSVILSISPASGIELATSRSAFKCSINWANPAAVIML